MPGKSLGWGHSQSNQPSSFGPVFLLLPEYSPNLNLKNTISTYTKEKNMAQIHQISYFKNSKSPEPYDNFRRVAKDIEGFCFFPTFI